MVCGPLVVQRPGLGGGAHGERTAGDEHFGRQDVVGGVRRLGRGEHRGAVAQLVRDEHGLVVLLLMLRDHAEGEAGVEQRSAVQRGALQDVQHPAADLGDIAVRLVRCQQRQRGARGAGVLEGVVDGVDVRAQRVTAADGAQQPLLLLVAYVGQVPYQRGHQRGVLRDEVGILDAGGEQAGAVAGGEQRRGRAFTKELGVEGHWLSFPTMRSSSAAYRASR